MKKKYLILAKASNDTIFSEVANGKNMKDAINEFRQFNIGCKILMICKLDRSVKWYDFI